MNIKFEFTSGYNLLQSFGASCGAVCKEHISDKLHQSPQMLLNYEFWNTYYLQDKDIKTVKIQKLNQT